MIFEFLPEEHIDIASQFVAEYDGEDYEASTQTNFLKNDMFYENNKTHASLPKKVIPVKETQEVILHDQHVLQRNAAFIKYLGTDHNGKLTGTFLDPAKANLMMNHYNHPIFLNVLEQRVAKPVGVSWMEPTVFFCSHPDYGYRSKEERIPFNTIRVSFPMELKTETLLNFEDLMRFVKSK